MLQEQVCRRFHPPKITVPAASVLRIHGYRSPRRVRPALLEMAEAMAQRAAALASPEAIYRRLRIERCAAGVLALEGGPVFRATAFTEILAGCDEVVVVILTLGPAIDAEVGAFTRSKDLLEALFLETAGWVLEEKATRELAAHLSARARDEGHRLTRRLGPGYGDWNLAEQKALFSVFTGTSLPVRLLESCAMVPKMSRSGLYGLRRDGGARTPSTAPSSAGKRPPLNRPGTDRRRP